MYSANSHYQQVSVKAKGLCLQMNTATITVNTLCLFHLIMRSPRVADSMLKPTASSSAD